jgi:ribonuclease G
VHFAEGFMPECAARLEHYKGDLPLFDLFSVEDEIQKALQRKVPLKSGGYLIFDQTEAMTTVDVNTGGFVGHIKSGRNHFQNKSRSRTCHCPPVTGT